MREIFKNNPAFNDLSPAMVETHSRESISNLMLCTSYHFEDIEKIQEMANKSGELFTGEYGTDIKLPFKSCWFDFECKGLPGIALAAVVAHEMEDTSLFVESYTKGIGRDHWIASGITAYIGMGTRLEKQLLKDRLKNLGDKEELKIEMISDNIWFTAGMLKNSRGFSTFDVQYQEDKKEMLYLLQCFNSALLLLSCKNIQTEIVPAPAKLNKKRAKTGKPPVQEHRVLRLVLPKKKGAKPKGQGGAGGGGGWVQKPSFCSGHFKSYTAEAPLFGRLTGRYWWEPHVRGGESELGKIPAKREYVVIPRKES